jgi:hypothetical protein
MTASTPSANAVAIYLDTAINCAAVYADTTVLVDGTATAAAVSLSNSSVITYDISPASFNANSVITVFGTVLTGFA